MLNAGMLTYDPTTSLRHWPIPMRRFGLNPYNEPLYRIVFAPSRRHLVCGTWPDGSNKAVYCKRYGHLGDQWIMERWLPAEEYAKCSKAVWDRDYLILGLWPERGEYEICHVFETSGPTDANLEKLILWIEMGRKTPFQETHAFNKLDAENERKNTGRIQEDIIRDSLSAFVGAPMSGYHGGRSLKSVPVLKTANQLGLPTQGGQIRTRQNPRAPTFRVPLEL